MTTGTELAVREISLPVWQMIQAIAPTIRTSGLFGVPNEAAASAIMLKGYELGMGLTAAFEYIAVIDGKPALSPRGALAIVLQSKLCAGIEITPLENPVGCEVTARRVGGLTFTSRFTLLDASIAGLVKDGGGYKKYPRQMCQWRAVGYALDVVFPDVTGGLKRADEYGADLTPEGDVVEGSWTVAPVSPKPTKSVDDLTQERLNMLVEQFPLADIMAANKGRMPTTMEEIVEVDRHLSVQSVPMSADEYAALKPLEN